LTMLKKKARVVVLQTWSSSGKKGGDFAKSGELCRWSQLGTCLKRKKKQTQEKTCKQTRSEVQRYI
jgi:hypothetical protein